MVKADRRNKMSRVGNRAIVIPDNVKVEIKDGQILVEGPKGKEQSPLYRGISANLENSMLSFSLDQAYIDKHIHKKNVRKMRALHGLVRALANNAVVGTSTGFTITLEIKGVGYRAQQKGNDLMLQLGFSHDVFYKVSDEVKVEAKSPTEIIVTGTNKEKVGQTAAEIRLLKKPEPYKGKGIRYKGERVIMKAGKVGKK